MKDLDSFTGKRARKRNTIYQEEISYILDEVSSIKHCLAAGIRGRDERTGWHVRQFKNFIHFQYVPSIW